jgi:hypothetical protein
VLETILTSADITLIPTAQTKLIFNPFQCGSLGSAHRAASGPIRPDNIGLFGPLPPGEKTYPHSCGPIGEAPLSLLITKLQLSKIQ